jgi:hypothetical protein
LLLCIMDASQLSWHSNWNIFLTDISIFHCCCRGLSSNKLTSLPVQLFANTPLLLEVFVSSYRTVSYLPWFYLVCLWDWKWHSKACLLHAE